MCHLYIHLKILTCHMLTLGGQEDMYFSSLLSILHVLIILLLKISKQLL